MPFSDVENQLPGDVHVVNDIVSEISWTGITVSVRDTQTKGDKDIVDHVSGHVKAGRPPSLCPF